MNISIITGSGNKLNLLVNDSDKVIELKKKIEEEGSIPQERQRLIHYGKILHDDNLLKDYQIINGSKLHLIFSISGG